MTTDVHKTLVVAAAATVGFYLVHRLYRRQRLSFTSTGNEKGGDTSGEQSASAIIFDLDGTLLDSSVALLAAISAACVAVGVSPAPTPAAIHRLAGSPLKHYFTTLTGRESSDPAYKKFVDKFKAAYDLEIVPAFSDVAAGLAAIRAAAPKTLKFAIATTKPSATAVYELQAAGILGFFDHVQVNFYSSRSDC